MKVAPKLTPVKVMLTELEIRRLRDMATKYLRDMATYLGKFGPSYSKATAQDLVTKSIARKWLRATSKKKASR
jgi:hypothetical protein